MPSRVNYNSFDLDFFETDRTHDWSKIWCRKDENKIEGQPSAVSLGFSTNNELAECLFVPITFK